jgi:hypothetical protein
MVWALLIFLGVVLIVHWIEYRSSVTEYTFAQPARLDQTDELRRVLSEKTPIVIEVGALPWRPAIAETAPWVASIAQNSGSGAILQVPVREWLNGSNPGDLTEDGAVDLAAQMELTTGLADVDGARAWWWLPGLRDATVGVLEKGTASGLTWVAAERQWFGCSHGGPMTIWLVHSRYKRYLPNPRSSAVPINPWELTVADAPWIGRVQYIEVILKPGWAIGIPAHWGFAARASDEERSWHWTVAQHSMLSWFVTPPVGKTEDVTVPFDLKSLWEDAEQPTLSKGDSDE